MQKYTFSSIMQWLWLVQVQITATWLHFIGSQFAIADNYSTDYKENKDILNKIKDSDLNFVDYQASKWWHWLIYKKLDWQFNLSIAIHNHVHLLWNNKLIVYSGLHLNLISVTKCHLCKL